MELISPDIAPPHDVDASRASLAFPVGAALMLVVLFTLSGIFSCCYHWDKVRSLRRSFSHHAGGDHDHDKSKPSHLELKQNRNTSLPVLMPGDTVAKFIALPCPCQPPVAHQVVVEVQIPPYKPPHLPPPL